MATEFTLFPELITELRLEIWRQALPDPIKTPLYTYRKGCWEPRQLKEGDLGFEPGLPGYHNLSLEFDSSRLNPLHIELPMFMVNQEARDVTLEYMQRNRLTRSLSYHFLRQFDQKTDIVFLSSDDVDEFLCEPWDRTLQPDLLNGSWSFPDPIIDRLATSLIGFKVLKAGLGEFFSYTGSIKVIYVLPSLAQASMQPQELQEEGFIRCLWNSSQDKWEIIENDEVSEAGSSIEDLVSGMDTDLASIPGGMDFEIRVAASVIQPTLQEGFVAS